MNLIAVGQKLTMSSREIAELTGKRHDHVVRDIESLKEKLGDMFGGYPQIWGHPQNGQSYNEFILDQDTTMCLISGYDPVVRMKIIKRWKELETDNEKQKKSALPQDYISALEHLLESKKAEQLAIEQRNIAIATKSEIGERREATAMNTASQAVKKANKLEIELDRSKEYATIKRMEMKYHGTKFSWRLLKSTGIDFARHFNYYAYA